MATIEKQKPSNSLDQEQDAYHLEKVEASDVSSRGSDRVQQGENKLTFSFFMTMLGFSMAFIVAEVTPLFLATCFTIIAFDLGAIDQLIWVIVTPYIATASVAPFVGALSDLIGRKGIIITSMGMATVSFAILGATPNFAGLIVGQVICGAAIGIQLLTVISAASELVPVAKRGATIGYIVMGFLPFAAASYYGQAIAQHSWRWIFLIIGVWSLISMVVLAIWYKPPPIQSSVGLTKMDMIKRIDFIGFALSVTGLVIFLIGINWGGQTYAWNSYHVLCAVIGGGVIMIVFVIYEIYFVKYPMFPSRLIQSKRHFFAVALLCFTSGINYIPLTVFWTLQVYTVYKASFAQAGIWLLPLGFCIAGGAIMSAIAMSVFQRHIQWVLLFFCIMQTLGIACMSLFDHNNIATVWAPMIFGLFGVGAVLLPSQVVFSVISPDDLIGTSVSLSVVIRMVGQVVGKSMFYNIFREDVQKNAPSIIAGPAIQAGFTNIDRITKLVTTLSAGPLSHYLPLFPEIDTEAKLNSLVEAGALLYGKTFPKLYLISIPFGALACFSCLLLFGVHKYIDNHTAVHLGH